MTATAKAVMALTVAVLVIGCSAPTEAKPPRPYEPVRATFSPIAASTPTPTPTASPAPSPTPTAAPTRKPKPKATPKPAPKRHAIAGVATWYCLPGRSRCTRGFPAGGAYGAAGPELRAALGKWRGKTVWVNGVAVKLIDWCACGGNHVIDVYHSTWVRIPHPSRVTIRW